MGSMRCTGFKIALNLARQQGKEKTRDTKAKNPTLGVLGESLEFTPTFNMARKASIDGKIRLMPNKLKISQANLERARVAHDHI
ncbi:hypothetical protein JTB14_008847 [Gonioctena quinquepunctata]|nr:hypothetical protein JTB14_008847 [Gonioctena quinquepunctata]